MKTNSKPQQQHKYRLKKYNRQYRIEIWSEQRKSWQTLFRNSLYDQVQEYAARHSIVFG